MSLCNAISSEVQVKVFEDSDELNCWLKEHRDVQILDIKFRSTIIIDEFILRNRFLVI